MVLVCILAISAPLFAQEGTTTGTVVSSTRSTLTIRSGTGQVQLFVYGNNVRKPASLPVGSQVRIVSSAGNEPDVRVANEVTIVEGANANAANSNQGAADGSTVPPEIRRIERDIEREARRYQLGIRGGVALDPELIMIGVHGQVGPFFRSDIFFRPSVEFGLGEVTALFAFNPEIIYRLPFSSAQDRWSTYFGAGLGINLLHQNFEKEDGTGRIDFGEFHSDTALNVLAGIRRRGGVFMELKTSVYSDPSPTLRMTVGYNF
jgi:hypothetical protein